MANPYPSPTTIKNLTALAQYDNVVTEGWFGAGLVLVIFIVAFLSLKTYATHKALAAATVLTMIIAIIFFIIGLVSTQILLATIILMIVSVVWLWIADKQDT